MSEMIERGAIAMQERFKDRIANVVGKPFAETGVELPSMDIWRDYAAAVITAMREPTEAMEDAADALDDWGVPSDPGSGNASAVAHWHAMIEEALK